MSRPVVIKAGPLAASSATKVALAQSPNAAAALALNGAAGVFTANSIALSQSIVGATAVVLNGAKAVGTPAIGYPATGYIYITSAGNDTGITFAVVGRDINGATLTETITGVNTSVAASTKFYYQIVSITASGSTAAAISVGNFGVATLDNPRRLLFTSSGTDTALTITVKGTNWSGQAITETLAGGSSGVTVQTVLDYLTVTQITVSGATAGTMSVGTSGVGGSPWVAFDSYYLPQVAIEAVVSGTINYTIQTSMDDPNSPTNAVAAASMTWVPLLTSAVSAGSSIGYAPQWANVVVNSGTGSVTVTFSQLGFRP